ncbi:formimidoylglutamate deiminase [Plantactinospora sp. S1510]|uniref:Formimidoylglutamate deiminase n=1 Tax=Plantactinospora alkalitolerans TaxID=2789879 RepID=A0ABS0H4L4_9ACTN|nr:formimidoylglutamate deiminase [Plantactinospora alkalitolerans]MBF9133398.1 formimidoylglutamate deiminase [Plantactinospora alkalitolerans]
MSGTTRYHAEYAWLPGRPVPDADVLIELADGRFTGITTGVPVVPADAYRLSGLTLPGLANTHSHAFHRALRGRTGDAGGSFWTWRDRMYAVAGRLDPDSYLALARATYAEMALAGITCVGEFHYLHHGPDGRRYHDPNAMSAALVEAAAEAGIRITLLDTCYLTASVDGQPLTGPQLRFGDGDAGRWADRAGSFAPTLDNVRVGAAIHSVRAVPADQIPVVVDWADERGEPLHVHLSEQPAENEACLAYHGRTPTGLLADAGALGPETTAVHATHLTEADRTLLGGSGTGACLCPTTERDLADGIGPARPLVDAGCPVSLGSDSHAVIDLFEEARGVEAHERLRTLRRGHFTPAELLHAATGAGHAALGWTDAGTIAVGARADLVTVRLDSARTAGVPAAGALGAATAADVTDVLVDGRVVVRDGRHVTLDVPSALTDAIGAVVEP